MVFCVALPDGLRRSATKETALGVSLWAGRDASRQQVESLDDFRYVRNQIDVVRADRDPQLDASLLK